MRTIACLALLSLAACGREEKSESFEYSFTENGCETGSQKVESKDALCARLKDARANQGCAYGLREGHFKANGCPGTFSG